MNGPVRLIQKLSIVIEIIESPHVVDGSVIQAHPDGGPAPRCPGGGAGVGGAAAGAPKEAEGGARACWLDGGRWGSSVKPS